MTRTDNHWKYPVNFMKHKMFYAKGEIIQYMEVAIIVSNNFDLFSLMHRLIVC